MTPTKVVAVTAIPLEAQAVVALVLTAIPLETQAVLRHLDNRHSEPAAGIWFEIGQFGSWTVAVGETGAGNIKAATVATRALSHFEPRIAAFVGIAGGVKDVALGDVVVATKVYSYESGKETADGFYPRPNVQHSHHELEHRARALSRQPDDWQARLPAWPDRKASVHIGAIASGEAVVADDAGRIATILKLNYSDSLAVEMEGYGFLEAARVHSACRAVVVRGISDHLSGKAEADCLGWQRRAADAAAAFFFGMLAFETELVETESAESKTVDDETVVFSPQQLSTTMANPRYMDDLSRLDRKYDRKDIINRETGIIVVGSRIPSELLDRPVAESLRDEIDRRGGAEHPFRRAIVLTDSAWNEEAPDVALNAVIAIGSHRANELSKKFQEEPASGATRFPIAGHAGCNALFQKNSIGLPQVALWGEHAVDTCSAVALYTKHKRGLDKFLKMTWDDN